MAFVSVFVACAKLLTTFDGSLYLFPIGEILSRANSIDTSRNTLRRIVHTKKKKKKTMKL